VDNQNLDYHGAAVNAILETLILSQGFTFELHTDGLEAQRHKGKQPSVKPWDRMGPPIGTKDMKIGDHNSRMDVHQRLAYHRQRLGLG